MKIITVCGSIRFEQEMKAAAEQLALDGNCPLLPLFPLPGGYSEAQKEKLSEIHKERIRLSDAIYVVNADGYIGTATQDEIDFARALGKEILYQYWEEQK